MSADEPKPKLIIDEDWKSQVEAEKAALAREAAAKGATEGGTRPTGEEPLPPASLSALCTSLAAQAMGALGVLADPQTGEPLPARPDEARYFIDMLGVLEEKTAGNRTADESALLSDVLHQLRMLFVTAKNRA